MSCGVCEAANPEGSRFCHACGARLAKSLDSALTSPIVPGAATSLPAAVVQALAPVYTLERWLGRGGMGEVFLGRDLELDRDVAIKVLPAGSEMEPNAIERFLREARIAARLRHPNVISIHAVGERSGVFFFTMDYIDGETLGTYVRRLERGRPLTPAEAIAVVRPILAGVGHAHARGVVHRDIKPANVMIDRSGHVTVMDFGLARRAGEPSFTATGAVMGTPSYMSPEQRRGEPATAGSDIYSLGLLLRLLLVGDDLALGEAIGDSRVPVAIAPLLARMLAKDPAGRPRSVQEVLDALPGGEIAVGPAAAGPGAEAESPVVPSPRPSPSPYRREARQRLKELLDKLPGKEE